MCATGYASGGALTAAPQIEIVERLSPTGTVRNIKRGQITIVNQDGIAQTFQIQQETGGAIAVAGGEMIFRLDPRIRVHGQLDHRVLQRGHVIRFQIEFNDAGKPARLPDRVELMDLDTPLACSNQPADQPRSAQVTGRIAEAGPKTIRVRFPPHPRLPDGELELPTVLDKSPGDSDSGSGTSPPRELEVILESSSLEYVKPGDVVTACAAGKLNTGDLVIGDIDIEMAPRDQLEPNSIDEKLRLQFAHLSGQPLSAPAEYSSRNFLLTTEISQREANLLLAKLESMMELVSEYFRIPVREPIQCFVIGDLSKWPRGSLNPDTVTRIRNGEGFTVLAKRGNQRRSAVYSICDHALVQRQAVHAYLAQTFEQRAPDWYATGIAEIARNWRYSERDVSIHPVQLEYLKNSPRIRIGTLIQDAPVAAERWQDQAWRWALSHFLVHNPNYAKSYKKLGLQLLQQPVSGDLFTATFGDVAAQLKFEFEFFLSVLQNGLRADLLAWPWNVKARKLSAGRKAKRNIQAAYGWQAIGAKLEPGQNYRVVATGTWQAAADADAVDANGDPAGTGRLVGVIFKDYALSKPFELGSDRVFQVPQAGELLVRFQEDFSEIGDNLGELSVEVSRAE